ncbi:hypothetical protein [Cohnella sp. GCM10012308]|uniref:hypothetical protein n=1 Tax=Cohnella sp. GCM10012308 TaxID=3317329 RepID=UPI0036223612
MIDRAYYLSLCEDAQGNMDTYKSEAESHVAAWEYASGKRYDLTPFYFERNREARGRVSKKEQPTAYGKDEHGEIWITKWDALRDSVGYYSRSENLLVNRLYRNGAIDSVEEVVYQDGLPVRYVEFIVRGGRTLEAAWHYEEYYEYRQSTLTQINRYAYSHGHQPEERQFDFHYDGNGKLSEIRSGENKIVFMNITKSQAAILQEEVRSGLIEESRKAIEAVCRRAGTERIFCIGVYLHDEPDSVRDPIFQPGLERIRREQLSQQHDKRDIWNLGEHPMRYQESIEDKSVLASFERLIQYWEMKGTWWSNARKLWREVAVTLNEDELARKYPALTEDFVIFIDEEGAAIKDLLKSLPESKQYLFRS